MKKEIRIYGVSTADYKKGMSDENFIEIAENNGNVWSQQGFNELDCSIRNLVLRVFTI